MADVGIQQPRGVGGTQSDEISLDLAPADVEMAVRRGRDALLTRQQSDGHWVYELEADCTIPAEYILMMHFVDEIDEPLQALLAQYLRRRQTAEGGWPLYYGGAVDVSCSVKAYYALKLAGDDPQAPHMRAARRAILNRGGAARANVFTRIMLYQFRQVPWRAVPMVPVEIIRLPRWFPLDIHKIAYWSRTVVIPLAVLLSLRVRAQNPRGIGVRELFSVDPEQERGYFRAKSPRARLYLGLERSLRPFESMLPRRWRETSIRKAHDWVVERLNGDDGLGAIFPAMVNAYEMLVVLGYAADHPYRRQARAALEKLLVVKRDEAYCQPCVSPVWDTALAIHALEECGLDEPEVAQSVDRALGWLADRQVTADGDFTATRPGVAGGGWAFQYNNPHYPDLDDTAVVAWAMRRRDPERYRPAVDRAVAWLAGMQSTNGGFAAFDADNHHLHLNDIPFADHGALLDPPTEDVSARVATLLGHLGKEADDREAVRNRLIEYLGRTQAPEGCWWGRWGSNYIYGTWSVLVALETLGVPADDSRVQRAADWLESVQRPDGGWGESNDSYEDARPSARHHAADNHPSTTFQTAWALLALLAAGRAGSPAVRRGVEYLVDGQGPDGEWRDAAFTAPGFPRVFYLKYHGYSQYFPLWALARYRRAVPANGR